MNKYNPNLRNIRILQTSQRTSIRFVEFAVFGFYIIWNQKLKYRL